MYVVGGVYGGHQSPANEYSNMAQSLDLAHPKNGWVTHRPMHQARSFFGAAVVQCQFYAFGGAIINLTDPSDPQAAVTDTVEVATATHKHTHTALGVYRCVPKTVGDALLCAGV